MKNKSIHSLNKKRKSKTKSINYHFSWMKQVELFYIFCLIAIVNIVYLLLNNEVDAVFLFIIIGLIIKLLEGATIYILLIPIIVVNLLLILKYFIHSNKYKEGLENETKADDDDEKTEADDDDEKTETESETKKDTEKDTEKETKKETKKETETETKKETKNEELEDDDDDNYDILKNLNDKEKSKVKDSIVSLLDIFFPNKKDKQDTK